MFRRILTACLLSGVMLWAPLARADAAAAEALFEQGRQAMESKEYDVACEKFRESQRLDPAAGTQFNLANCEEQRGNLATAWELYRAVIEQLPADDTRLPIAKERVAGLATRLPKLTITLAPDAPKGTTVERDGVALGSASLGVALPVDPGKHELVVKAPNHGPKSFLVTIGEKESKSVAVGPGAPGATEDAKPAAGSDNRTLGYVFGGIGVAGLAIGTVTGIMALSKKSTVDSHCDGDRLCDAEGADAAASGRTLGTITTISWIVGAAGIGAGAYFLLSSSPKSETGITASVAPGASSFRLLHRW
jgi:hypothetical protein